MAGCLAKVTCLASGRGWRSGIAPARREIDGLGSSSSIEIMIGSVALASQTIAERIELIPSASL